MMMLMIVVIIIIIIGAGIARCIDWDMGLTAEESEFDSWQVRFLISP